MFENIYKGRRVLVTGHTGFKGSWLSQWLLDLGAEVAGYSLYIPSVPSNFVILNLEKRIKHFVENVADRNSLKKIFDSFQPEMVFHLAAQAIVRTSYDNPAETFESNTLGTMNVLECIRNQESVRAAVIITSDKCYQNNEWERGYKETDRLGGEDPYSASKACAELISSSYMQSFFQNEGPRVATTRAGNVIGGGDWAADRIVPDCVRAWSEGKSVTVRNPQATRPWQHVLEPLSGYLWVGANLWEKNDRVKNQAFNFGPLPSVNQSVEELISTMAGYWDKADWKSEPGSAAGKHESTLLKLDCDKALELLGWQAALSFEDTVRFTSEWYRGYYNDGHRNAPAETQKQIAEYVSHACEKGLKWAT